MKHKFVLIVICVVVLLLGLVIGFKLSPKAQIAFAGLKGSPVSIFGTQTGTSTAATADGSFFGATNPTSSKAVSIEGQSDVALITIKAKTASTSALGGSFYEWNILGSNDAYCDTSSSTAGTGAIKTVKSDINWYLADPTNTRLSGRVTNPGTATGTSILLKDINWKCLKFELNGSSSTVLLQMKEKTN